MSNEVVNLTMLTQIEHQIEGMKLKCYQPRTIEWTALDLAFEAVRIARFAVSGEPAKCKMHIPSLDGATHQLVEALYPLETEEPQQDLPLNEAVPEWLEAA